MPSAKLRELAQRVKALSYGDMIDFATNLWPCRNAPSPITKDMLPPMLYLWSIKRIGPLPDEQEPIDPGPQEEPIDDVKSPKLAADHPGEDEEEIPGFLRDVRPGAGTEPAELRNPFKPRLRFRR